METIRVLLVDDHAVVRIGIRDVLNRTNDICVVAEAEDGQTARELIGALNPDVLVLDIRLGDESGIEIARWARQAYPELAITMLSAYDDAPFLSAAIQAGVNGYLLKTAVPELIVQGIRDVYAGKLTIDSDLAAKLIGFVNNGGDTLPASEALTDRELEVLTLAGKGYTNKAVGRELSISRRTVQGHLARIFKKLEVNNRTEAVMRAVSLGLITPENEG